VTTFICRGLLNPPSGADDGLSMGVLSRHVEETTSLALTLDSDHAAYFALGILPITPAFGIATGSSVATGLEVSLDIDYVAVGTNTDVSIILTIPQGLGGTRAGAVYYAEPAHGHVLADVEAGIEALNAGWTVTVTDVGASYTIEFEKASLSAGSGTLSVGVAGYHGGHADEIFWMFSHGDDDGDPNDVPTLIGPFDLTVTGTSNEATAAGDSYSGISAAGLVLSTTADGDPRPSNEEYSVPITVQQYGFGASPISLTVYVTDSVTTDEPTVLSNPDSWTAGSWTSPGGSPPWGGIASIQWQCTFTRSGLPSSGVDPSTITIGITPTEVGTLEAGASTEVSAYSLTSNSQLVSTEIAWSTDATSSKGVPANEFEWQAVLASAGLSVGGDPSHLFLCQEASGDLIDQIGAVDFADFGTVSYSNAISGWDRDGVGTTDGTNGGFGVGSGSGPDPSSTSVMYLAYVRIDGVAGAAKNVMSAGSTDPDYLINFVNTDGTMVSYVDGAGVTGATNYEGGSVFPLVLRYDRTNSAAGTFTDSEKIINTYSAGVVDGAKFLGNASGFATPPTARFLYLAIFEGAAAELTNTQIKTLLQTLGWTVSFTP
jgi:hypothetical protein